VSADADADADARSRLLPVALTPDFRLVALASLVALTFSYGSVLYHVTDVVGGSRLMLAVLLGSASLAVAVGRILRVRTAMFLTLLILGSGVTVYFLSVPASQRALISPVRLVSDTVALLTGLSVLRLTQANVWALSVAPAPVFLSWYLAVRRHYVGSVVVGGVALGLLVLTGDAGTFTTLAGVVGGAAVVGFGTLDRYGGTAAQVDTLVICFVAMVVVASTLSIAPTTRAGPVLPDRTSPTGVTSFVDSGDSVQVVGTIRLSPQVQFTVESPAESYWATGTYDRYTGSGWVRSGDTDPYVGRLTGPPGGGREVRQTVTAETELGAMPAAWRPVAVDGTPASRVRVTSSRHSRRGEHTHFSSDTNVFCSGRSKRRAANERSDAPDRGCARVGRRWRVRPDGVARRSPLRPGRRSDGDGDGDGDCHPRRRDDRPGTGWRR